MEPAIILARHIEEYCRRNIKNAFPPVSIHLVNETDVTALDAAIDKHIQELRFFESTIAIRVIAR